MAARPFLTVLATVVAIAVLMLLGGAVLGDRVPEALGHALSHAFVGGPVAVLVALAVRSWPPPRETSPAAWGRRLALLGLVGIVVGQILEIAGARVDEPNATLIEGVAHTAGMIVSTLSLLVTAGGALLAVIAAARDRAIPLWGAGLAVVIALVALWTLIVGAPGS